MQTDILTCFFHAHFDAADPMIYERFRILVLPFCWHTEIFYAEYNRCEKVKMFSSLLSCSKLFALIYIIPCISEFINVTSDINLAKTRNYWTICLLQLSSPHKRLKQQLPSLLQRKEIVPASLDLQAFQLWLISDSYSFPRANFWTIMGFHGKTFMGCQIR